MWKSENSLQELVLAFHYVDSRDCEPQGYVPSPTEPSLRAVVSGLFLSNKMILLAQILQKSQYRSKFPWLSLVKGNPGSFHSYTYAPLTFQPHPELMKIAGPHLL